MPVLTPNYLLPVPGPLDSPCDFAQQWCGFTGAVQTILDRFEAVADRTNPVVPIAKMTRTASVTLLDDNPVPFDNLILNNANMVDFDANRTTVTIKRPGRYQVIFNVLFDSPAVANLTFMTQLRPIGATTITPTPAIFDTLDTGADIHVGLVNTGVMHVSTPPVYVNTNVEGFAVGVDTVTVVSAALTVYWYADRATP